MPRLCSLLTVLFLLLIGSVGSAQPAEAQSSSYLRGSIGLSDYSGDAGGDLGIADFFDDDKFAQESFPVLLSIEAGRRLSSSRSLALGYQLGQYPFASGSADKLGTVRHTLYIVGRSRLGGPTWLVTPYLDAGLNLAVGGANAGAGPSIGGGLAVSLSPRIAAYLETRLHAVFGDGAVDGSGPRGVPFDVLSALPAAGLQMDL